MQKTVTLKCLTAALVLGWVMLAGSALQAAPSPQKTWINVTGEIVSCGEDAVVLDYGTGRVAVRMGALSWCINAAQLDEGHQITVYSLVNTAGGTPSTLDALVVYVHRENAVYAGTQIDRKDGKTIFADPIPTRDGDPINAIGMILKITGEEFRLDTGSAVIAADTGKMSYDPFAEDASNPLKEGDIVTLTGYVDTGPFRHYEIQAKTITRLTP